MQYIIITTIRQDNKEYAYRMMGESMACLDTAITAQTLTDDDGSSVLGAI